MIKITCDSKVARKHLAKMNSLRRSIGLPEVSSVLGDDLFIFTYSLPATPLLTNFIACKGVKVQVSARNLKKIERDFTSLLRVVRLRLAAQGDGA